MSSEDSSDLMGSGNVFEGDSLGSSRPVGELNPMFLWTESSGDNSSSQGREVAARGGQDNEEASSLGHERWSCVDLISTISMCEACRISKRYNVEVGFPKETGRPHNPPTGHVTVSEAYLKFGVRFPLHPYFVGILKYFNLTMFQLSPKGWAHMVGLFVFFAEQKIGPPTPEEFSWFYTLKPCQGDFGFYYFSKRASKGL